MARGSGIGDRGFAPVVLCYSFTEAKCQLRYAPHHVQAEPRHLPAAPLNGTSASRLSMAYRALSCKLLSAYKLTQHIQCH
eukprot:5485717-Pyramimonas_sp.AAC.1